MSGLARSVIPLLSEWEKYAREEPDGDITGFAKWILANQAPANHQSATQEPAIPQSVIPQSSTQEPPIPQPVIHAAPLITRTHRLLAILSKPIIKDLGFTKDIEFAAVVHVAVMDNPNKKELCFEMLIENSTGVEITRRLVQKGIIAERPDPNDRRSARLSITEKGKKLLEQANRRLAPLHASFLDALESDEKENLVNLLTRVNKFHTDRLLS